MKLPALPIAFLLSVFLYACHSPQIKDPAVKDVPKALQDNERSSFSIKDYRSGNLLEDIYNDMLDKRTDLKELEGDLSTYREKERDSLGRFGNYKRKSTLYYEAAISEVKEIKDSILRKQMEQAIAASKIRYGKKGAAGDQLLAGLYKEDTILNDYNTVLKLLVTLPVMEKFQNDALPDNKILHTLSTEKQKLIDRIQKATPKTN